MLGSSDTSGNAGCSSACCASGRRGLGDRGVPVRAPGVLGAPGSLTSSSPATASTPWSATSGSSEMSASELRKDSGERVRRRSRRSRAGRAWTLAPHFRSFGGRCAAGSRQRRAGATPGQLSGPSRIRARTNTTSSLAGLSDNMCPHSTDARPARAAGAPCSAARWRRHAQRLAMRRSTRSSWERNGSFKSTVRWAWSFSLRCTQSTVKSGGAPWPAARRHRAGGPGLSGGLGHCQGDVGVVQVRSICSRRCKLVEEATAPVDVVVGEVGHRHLGVRERQVVAGPYGLDQAVLGYPVATPATRRGGPIRGPSGSAPTCRGPGPPRGEPVAIPEAQGAFPSTRFGCRGRSSRARWPGAPAADR